VQNISKHFSDKKRGLVKAVDELSFECKPGSIFGLLGLNGAGKTTMLRLLATMLRPTSGTAKVAGFDVIEQSDRVKANIGFLTGNTGLYLRLTPREIIAYFGKLAGMDSATLKQRSSRLIDLLDMGEFADRRIDKLSTGQKQKTSIARTMIHNPPITMIHNPPILILDEPTAGLDVLTSRAIIQLVRDAKDEGKCVIFSTHIMHEAANLCDEIAVIHEGRMRTQGTLAQFREQYGMDNLDDIFVAILENGGGR
jgi:sodium transport system ATP-binding protein